MSATSGGACIPNPWIDRLPTRLNACSLETLYTPIGDGRCYYPLVIGCYQLDDKPSGNEASSSSSSSSPAAAFRRGELLLHSIDPQELKFGRQHDDDDNNNDKTTAEAATASATASHHQHQQQQIVIDTDSGVLDGKWLQAGPFHSFRDFSSSSYMYATANASGAIHVYRLNNNNNNSFRLEHVACTASDEKKKKKLGSDDDNHGDGNNSNSNNNNSNDPVLALSLAWDEHYYNNSDDSSSSSSTTTSRARIVSSYSNGALAVHNVASTTKTATATATTTVATTIEESVSWNNAHTLFGCPSEVWTCCFANNKQYNTYRDTVLSGGDDCKLKLWDLRTCSGSGGSSSNVAPIMETAQNVFDAGVTAVSYHPTLEHIFAAGSYDEVIRIWDMRKLGGRCGATPPSLANVSVGGGVWRIKWHPKETGKMLVGAMHGGCRIVEVPGLQQQQQQQEEEYHPTDAGGTEGIYANGVRITKEFTAHESMAYGADWIYDDHVEDEEERIVEAAASCSFYDRQAFLWD